MDSVAQSRIPNINVDCTITTSCVKMVHFLTTFFALSQKLCFQAFDKTCPQTWFIGLLLYTMIIMITKMTTNLSPQPQQYTLTTKQAKIISKSVILNKINTLFTVILWLLTFWSSNILWPPIFLSKNMTPLVYSGHLLLPKKMSDPK